MRKYKIIIMSIIVACLCLLLIGCSEEKDNAPYIGENGNWWVGKSDLGVQAQGPRGAQGAPGVSGEQGANGESVSVVAVNKTDTQANVDTYTIYFSDNTSTTFSVTNGEDGECVTVASISKTETTDTVDTYTISFSDGTQHIFTVTNGADGQSVSIGDNGNWWIGDTDTGILADSSLEEVCTPGLKMENMTVGGRAGLVVTGIDTSLFLGNIKDFAFKHYKYQLTDADMEHMSNVVNGSSASLTYIGLLYPELLHLTIPNSVGTTPVIGIYDSAFMGNKFINKITLSENTIYMGAKAFQSCKMLREVDFNGAELLSIPSYAFAYNTLLESITLPDTIKEIGNYAFTDTGLTSIELPKPTTKLGDYSFNNVCLKSINYENVTHIGQYSLPAYYGSAVYLTKAVEYVGSYAFMSSYVYIEHETLPETWGSNIAGTNDVSEVVTMNCMKNSEYIYSVSGLTATVYYYIGESERITIPSAINNVPVTKIGYGFNSLTENAVEIMADMGIIKDEVGQFDALYMLREVKIPNTVTQIEYGSFICYGTMIFIPSSVNAMWGGIGSYTDRDMVTSYLAFESTSYPTIKSNWLDTSSSISSDSWISNNGSSMRIGIGIDPTRVSLDEANNTYYYREAIGYSLLAIMNYSEYSLTIKATYNQLPVTTIRPDAVSGLFFTKTIEIENGITKIQSYAFDNLGLSYVYIPVSVTTINAYGFDSVCSSFYIGAPTKPAEWDSYWAGSSTSSKSLTYSSTCCPLISDDNLFVYTVNTSDTIELVKYLGNSSSVYIPRTIKGKTVTAILSNFYVRSGSYSVYIPKAVTTIQQDAFRQSSSSYTTFYFEAASLSSGISSIYFFNSYYGSYMYRQYVYMGQILTY